MQQPCPPCKKINRSRSRWERAFTFLPSEQQALSLGLVTAAAMALDGRMLDCIKQWLRGWCIRAKRTHADREQHPRHRHTHTQGKNNTPNPQTNTSPKHSTTLEGKAAVVNDSKASSNRFRTSESPYTPRSAFPSNLHRGFQRYGFVNLLRARGFSELG